MKITSIAVPLRIERIDTDQIIPARFLKATERVGFGKNLFYDWRYDASGKPKKEMMLHHPRYQKAQILLVGKDFGIGSSREHAAWALYDYGFRVIIGTSFGDIFFQNSIKNGLLLVTLKTAELEKKFELAEKYPEIPFTVDLVNQYVSHPHGFSFNFQISAFHKKRFIDGLDEIGYILSHEEKIKQYEQENRDITG